MEFKFRAGDDRPASSSSTVRYFSSERTIRGPHSPLTLFNFFHHIPTSQESFFQANWFFHPGPSRLRLHRRRARVLTRPVFRIRIISRSMTRPTPATHCNGRWRRTGSGRRFLRRRVLEAEVRRELMMEREIAMKKAVGDGLGFEGPFGPMQQAQSFDHRVGFSSRSSSPLAMVPRLPEPVPDNLVVNEELTAPAGPLELNNEKLILLAKPNPDLSGLKRKKLPSEGANEIYQYTMKKKKKKIPKEEWSCALCQVTVTDEKTFEGHLNGKRHKASEKRLGAEILGKSSSNAPISKSNAKLSEPKGLETTAAASSQLGAKEEGLLDHNEAGDGSDKKDTGISKEKTSEEKKVELRLPVQKDQCGEDSRNNVEVKTVHMMQRKEEPTKTKRFEVLCEICKVGSNNPKVMEQHRSGKKHMDKLKELRKNKFQTTNEANVNTPTTNSVSSSGAMQEAVKGLQQDIEISVAAANVIKEANASISTTIPVASLAATEKAETVELQESTHVPKEADVSIPNAVAVISRGPSEETKAGRLLEEVVKNNVPTTNVTKEAIANMPTTTSVAVESFWATQAAEISRKLEAYEKLIKAKLTE